MKILKLGRWRTAAKEMAWMIAVAVVFILLTTPAHAEAIGQMQNKAGGTITVFDDPCVGKAAMWFRASSYSSKDGPTAGCWRVYDRDSMEVEWNVDGKPVTAHYLFDSFYQPHNL